MNAVKSIFYQWQKSQGYPVFLKLAPELHEGRLQKLITDLGFQEMTEAELKKSNLSRAGIRILSLSKASPRVAFQVMTPDSLEKYGQEVLSHKADAQVYLYRRLGLMVFSHSSNLWELGLASTLETTDELMGMRVMLNRYLAWALANHNVVGFWGVTNNNGFVVMKQAQSFGEAVFVDMDKRRFFSTSGVQPMEAGFTIVRADKTDTHHRSLMAEELVSFLSTCQIYLTHSPLPSNLKRVALRLGSTARGEWSTPLGLSHGLSNT